VGERNIAHRLRQPLPKSWPSAVRRARRFGKPRPPRPRHLPPSFKYSRTPHMHKYISGAGMEGIIISSWGVFYSEIKVASLYTFPVI
jgi:hypothetical protein